MKVALLVALALETVAFIIYWAMAAKESRPDHSAGGSAFTPPVRLFVGFFTNFLDTLGIGSFATTTSTFKFLRGVKDEAIPGTMNVGHAIPTVAEALIYVGIITVDLRTLVLMIAASVLGAWLGAGVVCHSMKESDIRTFYTQPWVMVSSDGGIGSRHPRGAGTYPRVLGSFVREKHWLSLPEAIRKMTLLPAKRFKLSDRGLIRAGFKADLVLFDANTIIDRATFQEPQLTATGVKRVFVNGSEVWIDHAATGQRPGRALRHKN